MAGVTRLAVEDRCYIWVVITGRTYIGKSEQLKARILMAVSIKYNAIMNTRMEHFYLRPEDNIIIVAWDADQ